MRLGQQPVTEAHAKTRVEEWIDPQTRRWKEATVRATISDEETDIILKVSSLFKHNDDVLRCLFERCGKVMTRSTYHLLRLQQRREENGEVAPGGSPT